MGAPNTAQGCPCTGSVDRPARTRARGTRVGQRGHITGGAVLAGVTTLNPLAGQLQTAYTVTVLEVVVVTVCGKTAEI